MREITNFVDKKLREFLYKAKSKMLLFLRPNNKKTSL